MSGAHGDCQPGWQSPTHGRETTEVVTRFGVLGIGSTLLAVYWSQHVASRDAHYRKAPAMINIRKAAVSALLSGGLALAGLGVAAGTAHADGPYHWCPGNPKNMPYVPNGDIDWDWSICHTWYPAAYGTGNVTMQGRPTSIWDGDNPPPEVTYRQQCPPIAFMCP
jgi:hypothetical protein